MARLRFSPAAARDLDKISSDIAVAAGVQVALAFVTRLRQSLDHLAAFPRIGRLRGSFGRGVRSWAFPPYVAFYRESGSEVEIIRIVHGKRRTTRSQLRGD